MEDPVFSYLIIKKLQKKINIKKIYIFDSPKFSIRRMIAIMLVMGLFSFVKHCISILFYKLFFNGKLYYFAKSNNIQCELVSGKNFDYVNRELLNNTKNTLLFSIFCNYKIPNNTLKLFGYNAANIHLGKIPEYKGILSIFYSLLDGTGKLYYTIHRINNKFDSGNILSSGFCKVINQSNIYESWKLLCNKSADDITAMLKKDGLKLRSGKPHFGNGEYYSIPSWKLIYKFFTTVYLRKFF